MTTTPLTTAQLAALETLSAGPQPRTGPGSIQCILRASLALRDLLLTTTDGRDVNVLTGAGRAALAAQA